MSFRVLAIDGGGIRGIFPAQILADITAKLKLIPADTFQLVAGTSTGSIIAAAVATQTPMSEVVELYLNEGAAIFKRRWFAVGGNRLSKYKHDGLQKILERTFGDITLGSIKTPLVIPATDISTGNVHVFKSGYNPEFLRDKDVRLVDAIIASCSAPTFFDPYRVGELLLADGGLWANNPGLVARTEAITRLAQAAEDIKLFSIGTGIGRTYYGQNGFNIRRWGFLTGWQKSKFIELLMNLQSMNAHNTLSLIMPKHNYKRINFNCADQIPLDSAVSTESIRALASRTFTEQTVPIKEFLS